MNIIEKLGITPGPWKAVRHSWSHVGVYSGTTWLSNIDTGEELEDEEKLKSIQDVESNLIASSPEMLEALIDISIQISKVGFMIPDGVIEIIQKATGKSWGEIKLLMEEK